MRAITPRTIALIYCADVKAGEGKTLYKPIHQRFRHSILAAEKGRKAQLGRDIREERGTTGDSDRMPPRRPAVHNGFVLPVVEGAVKTGFALPGWGLAWLLSSDAK
jgi:hypothetical protein